MQKHITLLGDSVFDNKIYVPDGSSVHEHLLDCLTQHDTASLVAVDGAVISSVFRQLDRIPRATTHLMLSVGGNDALYLQSSVMGEPSVSVHDSLAKMKAARDIFERDYLQLIKELQRFELPTAVCTIYDGVPGLDDASLAGVAIINDIITRTAANTGCDLIDLRVLCNEADDYSGVSPIEPSHKGGSKIAALIVRATSGHAPASRVFC